MSQKLHTVAKGQSMSTTHCFLCKRDFKSSFALRTHVERMHLSGGSEFAPEEEPVKLSLLRRILTWLGFLSPRHVYKSIRTRLTFQGVRITSVLSITAGGNHAWVESSVGRIRKPLGSIPSKLIEEYRTA